MDRKLIVFLILVLSVSGCTSGTNTRQDPVCIKPALEQPTLKRFQKSEPDSIMYTGWKLARSGSYQKSAVLFEQMINEGYRHYDLYFGAGYSYFKYYDLDKALKYLTLAIDSRNDHFEALFFRAKIYLEMKNYPAARGDINKILSISKPSGILCGMFSSDRLTETELALRKNEAKMLINLK